MKHLVSLLLVGFIVLPGFGDLRSLDPFSSQPEEEEYVITIVSHGPDPVVNFLASYVFGDEDMVVINTETPYRIVGSGPRLNAIIQSESPGTELKAYFGKKGSDEDRGFGLSGTGRTIVFGTQWSKGGDGEMELNHYVTVR